MVQRRRIRKKRFVKLNITIRRFVENWEGHDYVSGIFTGVGGLAIVLLIWKVDAIHLWNLFRFHWVDMILATVAVICFRYCYMMYKARGIPKFKTDWPVFWDRNGPMIGLFAAGLLALALIDPQLTSRILDVFK